jgi:hypothetical protein
MTQANNVAIESSQINSSGVLQPAGGGTGLSAIGTAGQVLTVNSGATALQYSTPATTAPGGSNTQVQYNSSGSFAGSANFVFDGTNVGIGVTPNASWAGSGYTALQIGQRGVVMSLGTGASVFNIGTNFYYDGSSYRYLTTDAATQYQQNSGAHNWRIAASGTAGNTLTWTQAMTLDSAGNVGIGTSSPNGSLTVSKQLTALSGTSNTYGVHIYPSGTGTCYVDALTNSSSNSSLALRSYNNGTYYDATLDSSGNFKFNSGYGSAATAYGCRAWVNFNGTGTVATRGSGNVSSISDLGVGEYQVNFTTAMPDTNYNSVATPGGQEAGSPIEIPRRSTTPTTSAVRMIFNNGNSDSLYVSVSIFR